MYGYRYFNANQNNNNNGSSGDESDHEADDITHNAAAPSSSSMYEWTPEYSEDEEYWEAYHTDLPVIELVSMIEVI